MPAAPSSADTRTAALDRVEALYDALLYVVSHDVKSPLVSISLGAELLETASTSEEGARVALDARILTELLDVSSAPSTIDVDVRSTEVRLVLPLTEYTADLEGSPLELLLGSLTAHAGGTITALAGLEAQLERQGGALRISGARMRVTLPRLQGAAETEATS